MNLLSPQSEGNGKGTDPISPNYPETAESYTQSIVTDKLSQQWVHSSFKANQGEEEDPFLPLINNQEENAPPPLGSLSVTSSSERVLSDPKNLDLEAEISQALELVSSRSQTAKKRLLAIINALVWHYSSSLGVMEKVEDRGRRVILINNRYLPRLHEEPFDIQIATHWITDHLNERCEMLVSRTSVHNDLKWLRANGYLDWIEQEFSLASAKTKAKSRTYTYIDTIGLLILMVATERYLMETPEGLTLGLEMLPAHRYASSKLLFDQLFPGQGWNREATEAAESSREAQLQLAAQVRAKQKALMEKHLRVIEEFAALGFKDIAIANFKALNSIAHNEEYRVYVGDRLLECGLVELAAAWRSS